MNLTVVGILYLLSSYSNQILAEYEVQCEPEKTAFIDFEALDVEPSNCLDGSQTK